MAVEAVGLSKRDVGQLPGMEAVSSSGLCALAILARALATLLLRPVGAEQVRDKAVGLGLLRCLGADAPAGLDCRLASRLLLTGYRLPALVEPGSLKSLHDHLTSELLVLVPLGEAGADRGPNPSAGPALLQLHCIHAQGVDGPWLSLGEPEAPMAAVQQWKLPCFLETWSAAGGLLLVAARQWADLPREGRRFFGGGRDADGTYHWNVAECVTDAQGHVLRC